MIGARKLHHSRFFSASIDYGHQHYIDNLQNQRLITVRALESLEKRTAEVLFLQQEWFQWARDRQNEEEKSRDNEKKKIKKEAALLQRYQSMLEAHAKDLKRREDLKCQDAFLNEVYQERMNLKKDEDDAWDPIEDVLEDERATYSEIISFLLMLKDEIPESDAQSREKTAASTSTGKKGSPQRQATTDSGYGSGVETKSQMRKRLKDGTLYPQGASVLIRGTPNNPIEFADKTPSMSDDEIDVLLEEVSEIKHLLFCRLLLSHASLLPAAIRADSVDAFMKDADVKDANLRDLCLKMESPGPQEVRDACADLLRNEDEHNESWCCLGKAQKTDKSKDSSKNRFILQPYGGHDLRSWMPKSTRKAQKIDSSRKAVLSKTIGPTEVPDVDFGIVDDQAEYRTQRIRVKICGRYIYNYPSEKAMSRGGWLHFSVIAKDSNLSDAIKLCRSWDEFFELSILAMYQYFPAANWLLWAADREQTQLITLGFIPYGDMKLAGEMTTTRNRQTRRKLGAVEVRSFLAGSVKRNDQASRGLIKYLSMLTHRVFVLVRDAIDGRILIQPPHGERWLMRRGLETMSSLADQEWVVEKQVDGSFFEELERSRKWTVGFSEHFDIIVWDRKAGLPGVHVNFTVLEVSTLGIFHHCYPYADTPF